MCGRTLNVRPPTMFPGIEILLMLLHLISHRGPQHKLRNLGNLCLIRFPLLDQRDFETLILYSLNNYL